jgi:hypothetical protein
MPRAQVRRAILPLTLLLYVVPLLSAWIFEIRKPRLAS